MGFCGRHRSFALLRRHSSDACLPPNPRPPNSQGALSNARGGPFAVVNGAMAQDVLVVAVPPRARIERPLYVVNVSTAAAAAGGEQVLSASAPRLLIHLGKGAEAEVVEEYVSADEGAAGHAVFAVAEVVLDACASLRHGYVQREAPGSVHFKATLVDQGESSGYSLVEARVGGGLSRHDVGVQQDGAETTTRMRHFLLAGVSQLQDLHTKLALDHPRGEADQLHKCIVSAASGRGVFDGNVKVRGGGKGPSELGGRTCHMGLRAASNSPQALGAGTCSVLVEPLRRPSPVRKKASRCSAALQIWQPTFHYVIQVSQAHLQPSLGAASQVNRLAQKTDAGQLSRNLLLVPRATVNVKPNLQIIADDVKCTHGCAISDLSEEELFYFRCGFGRLGPGLVCITSSHRAAVQGLCGTVCIQLMLLRHHPRAWL